MFTDELKTSILQCNTKQFTCDNQCLDLHRKCDGIRDCMDSSDEANCSYSSTMFSDFDRIAQYGLFAVIGIIALVFIFVVVFVVTCVRRNKRRQMNPIESKYYANVW